MKKICCLGISTRPSNGHWISKFLQTLEDGIIQSQTYWGTDWESDFLLPSWTDSIPFSTLCSYHHGLALIRYLLQRLWLKTPLLTPDQALGLSTHSMKSTMLAAAGQLNLNIEQRAKQGHYKQSVQLYSRDDVWPSLFLQRDILIEIGSGWKPLTSQARGARQPLPEHPFSHLLSQKRTFNASKCPLAPRIQISNLWRLSKQSRPPLSHPKQLMITHHHRQIPTQALSQMKTFMYLRYIHPFWLSIRSLISFMLHLRSAQIPWLDLVSKSETNVSKLLVGHPLLEPLLTLLIPYLQAHVCAKEKHAWLLWITYWHTVGGL